MRILTIVTAAAIGIVASYGLANAQATNMAPKPGTAKTMSGTGSDVNANQQTMDKKPMMKSSKKMKKSKKMKSTKQM